MKNKLLDLLQAGWNERYQTPFNREQCEKTLDVFANNDNAAIIVHVGKDKQPAGIMIAIRGQGLCFEGDAVEVVTWYVIKKERGNAGREMVKHLEQWALADGKVRQISIAVNNPKEGQRTAQFLTHLGYQQAGSTLLKEV